MVARMALHTIAAGDSFAVIEEKVKTFCLPYGNVVGFRLIVDDRRSALSGIAVVEFERRDERSGLASSREAIADEGRALISFRAMAAENRGGAPTRHE